MLEFYTLRNARLERLDAGAEPPADVAWIDLNHPTEEEEGRIERLLSLDIPTREEMAEIEISSRLYEYGGALFMTAIVLLGADTPAPQNTPITFILTHEHLITVRYSDPSSFRNFVHQGQRADAELKGADGIFVALMEAIIDRTADILENVALEMDAVSRGVFQVEEKDALNRDTKAVMRRIGRNGDLNSKVRESLVSIGRLVNFLSAECAAKHPGLREHTATMAADIRSLTDHATYVAGTTAFLLDATLGLINIEQNAIIKIVSVISVLVMPPTLVGTIYGMNFRYMPELHWPIGYPLALLAMIVSAVIPYWYFRRRGWL